MNATQNRFGTDDLRGKVFVSSGSMNHLINVEENSMNY